MSELTYERANEVFRYEPESGRIFCRVNRGCARAGNEAGGIKKNRRCYYRRIKIDGKIYKSHRIAWLLHYGEWPNDDIDHRDGDGLNNRIDNLRDVDNSTNHRNQRMYGNNTSGVCGVHWHKRDEKWMTHIRINGKLKHLGYFATIAEAAAARRKADIKYGYTARHGLHDESAETT